MTRAFVSFVTCYGAVEQVISDRGSEFNSELFQSVCKRLNTVSHMTTAYNPASNGCWERYNGTLKTTLQKLATADKFSWDVTLPFAVLAINTSYQQTIEEIPYYLFFGRDAYLPYGDAFKPPPVDHSAGENYAAEMTARLFIAFQTVKEKSNIAHEKSVQRQQKKIQNNDIAAGSIVLLRNEAQQTSNQSEWPNQYEGLYRVLRRTKTNALIKHIHKNKAERNVHLNRLKKAYPRDENESIHPETNVEIVETEPDCQVPTINSPPKRYNLRKRR